MKHRLKRLLRELWARLLVHTGLHRLVDRLMPRRMLILGGHCVEHEACNGGLPADMKISRAGLVCVLARLGRHYELTTVGAGLAALAEGGGPSLVALTMDDGYRDNREVLLPLLEELGATATVFVESAPLDEREVNWTHEFFWLLDRSAPGELAEEYARRCGDERLAARLAEAAAGARPSYEMKRLLKYECDQAERDRILSELFRAAGGDARALCDRLYLSWEDTRALADAGIEIGAHTIRHPVLAGLGPKRREEEIAGARTALERGLGRTVDVMAYPFGRRWDIDEAAVAAVADAGFRACVTTHAGTVGASSDPLRLARWMIGDATPRHLLLAEACGGFDLLRRLGLDLSE
ncbi:MAG: polysaccharide deacetylase family protein [Planctomycetota bacterium]|jgi:peptidoglycan/xylan/chitin deacetylase (PgdA/CDA1 family)|nr:polysaccharide deacetylase family protein [Planctomycetota bacterium]MDP6762774.1 polysaccharide deacetylase family protein [Planctomycetota bacterium]MDP6990385.1 polysaccharide deacetylase family protein [Planctomycetota bacterium]